MEQKGVERTGYKKKKKKKKKRKEKNMHESGNQFPYCKLQNRKEQSRESGVVFFFFLLFVFFSPFFPFFISIPYSIFQGQRSC